MAPRSRRTLADRRDAEPQRIITNLLDRDVEFIVIGGVAAIAHGVQRITRDIDFLLEPSTGNCRKAIAALVELGAEEFQPAGGRWIPVASKADPRWLLRQPRFFDSFAGGIDLCNAMEGVPQWSAARSRAVTADAFGRSFLVLDKDLLIRSKLAAGREQDLQDVAELGEL